MSKYPKEFDDWYATSSDMPKAAAYFAWEAGRASQALDAPVVVVNDPDSIEAAMQVINDKQVKQGNVFEIRALPECSPVMMPNPKGSRKERRAAMAKRRKQR